MQSHWLFPIFPATFWGKNNYLHFSHEAAGTQLALGRFGIHTQVCIGQSPKCRKSFTFYSTFRQLMLQGSQERAAGWVLGSFVGQDGRCGTGVQKAAIEIQTLVFTSCWLSRNCGEAQGKGSLGVRTALLSGSEIMAIDESVGWRGGGCCRQ